MPDQYALKGVIGTYAVMIEWVGIVLMVLRPGVLVLWLLLLERRVASVGCICGYCLVYITIVCVLCIDEGTPLYLQLSCVRRAHVELVCIWV